PKRGFSNSGFRKEYHIVNVKALEAAAGVGDEVTVETLAAAGVIRDSRLPLKVLGEGDLTKKLNVTAAKFSASAKAKIEKAGGTATQLPDVKWGREGAIPASKPRKPHVDPKVQWEQAQAGKDAGKKPKKEKAAQGEEGAKAEQAPKAEKAPKGDKAPKGEN